MPKTKKKETNFCAVLESVGDDVYRPFISHDVSDAAPGSSKFVPQCKQRIGFTGISISILGAYGEGVDERSAREMAATNFLQFLCGIKILNILDIKKLRGTWEREDRPYMLIVKTVLMFDQFLNADAEHAELLLLEQFVKTDDPRIKPLCQSLKKKVVEYMKLFKRLSTLEMIKSLGEELNNLQAAHGVNKYHFDDEETVYEPTQSGDVQIINVVNSNKEPKQAEGPEIIILEASGPEMEATNHSKRDAAHVEQDSSVSAVRREVRRLSEQMTQQMNEKFAAYRRIARDKQLTGGYSIDVTMDQAEVADSRKRRLPSGEDTNFQAKRTMFERASSTQASLTINAMETSVVLNVSIDQQRGASVNQKGKSTAANEVPIPGTSSSTSSSATPSASADIALDTDKPKQCSSALNVYLENIRKARARRQQMQAQKAGNGAPRVPPNSGALSSSYDLLPIEGPTHDEIFYESYGFTRASLMDGRATFSMWAKECLPDGFEENVLGVRYDPQSVRVVENFVRRCADRSPESLKKLENEAWTHTTQNLQSNEDYAKKMEARQTLLNEFQKLLPTKELRLMAVGSTVNGCGSYNSDMDVCLCVPTSSSLGTTIGNYASERSVAMRILNDVYRKWCSYHNSSLRACITRMVLIKAKVPIIRLFTRINYHEVEIDVNVNNVAGIYNSHLIHYYSHVDSRFPALALIVKHWAIRNNVGDAQHGTFNSYSLILLVVHFLQCGVRPAVLPNLQHMFPEKFSLGNSLDDLELFQEILDPMHSVRLPNTWALSELVIGFFFYYRNFKFDQDAISIKSGCTFPRSQLSLMTSAYQVYIEEPFDGENTARAVQKPFVMRFIKEAFSNTCQALSEKTFSFNKINIVI